MLWLLLFPIVFSVWVWQTRYPIWARATASGVVLLVFGMALFSDSGEEAEVAAATQAAAPVTRTVTGVETIEADSAATVAEVTAPTPAPRTYGVDRVVDGDTIELENGIRVRLVQIDAPELSGACFSRKARNTLAALLPAGSVRVRLRFDPSLDKTDQYGRKLAYVFKGNELINLTLVRRGAASAFFYRGARGRYAMKLDSAAREARDARRGLWRACAATSYDPTRAIATAVPPSEPEPAPLAAPAPSAGNCHPSYEGACLDPNASDYDCEGGSGNGPQYTGFVRVVGYDAFDLDRDGDGAGCED